MKIIALEQEVSGTTGDDFRPHLQAEAARVWELYQTGVFRELYFRQDRPEAVLVLECEDLAEAEDIVGALPLVRAGLITFDLIPLKAYSGFARLFKEM